MLQPHRDLFCADIPSPVCKGRGLAAAAGLEPEQDCAAQLSPAQVRQKQRHRSVLLQVWVPKGSANAVPTQQQRGVSSEPPARPPFAQHLDPAGTAALSGKPVNYFQVQSGFPHLQLCSSWAVPTHGQPLQHHTLGHGRAVLHLFPSGTCCGSFTGSPGIPGWGSQHITPRFGFGAA